MANNDDLRDYITVEDENGNEKVLAIEALFQMEGQDYALLRDQDDTFLMRVEGEGENQTLVGIDDPSESSSILDAYQIAVDAAPADER